MYIKQVELSRFKSFGGTTPIPLLPGFTVISGPNGSGKSNILDALLFALGLSGSKGMRADRLPDLVNQHHSQKGRTAEASVTVTFALSNDQEWVVSRKLRVTSQGTYTSTYAINGSACTLGELHQQLSILHIYPEGYNIVLQGDVTSIISMNSRERRMIIDELAGVGEFDRKIGTAKEKLEDVRDQEERFRIVEQELIYAQEKLKADRVKAEKYQQLRLEWESLQGVEVVLQHRALQQQRSAKIQSYQETQAKVERLHQESVLGKEQLNAEETALATLQQAVQALGETEYLQLSSTIATHEAEYRSGQRQLQEYQTQYQQVHQQFLQLQTLLQSTMAQQSATEAAKQELLPELQRAKHLYDQQWAIVSDRRQELQAVAASAESWLQAQTTLRQTVQALQAKLNPLREEQARLQESLRQGNLQLNSQQATLAQWASADPQALQGEFDRYQALLLTAIESIQTLSQHLSDTQAALKTCQTTIGRLTEEQRQKQRQLDRLEAQQQATQEVQGTRATRILLESRLGGIHGLVSQLGTVEPRYRLALEIAAGGRLGCVVVEDDQVAAEAIQWLKAQKAGRATFLPLNRMKPAPPLRLSEAQGLGAVDYALNLVTFDERYRAIFAHVLGHTLIFDSLQGARRHLGRYRMVTQEGELLETSGAMTGGSPPQGGMHFGIVSPSEGEEGRGLRERLQEIEALLPHLQHQGSTLSQAVSQAEADLQQARLTHQAAQLQTQRLQAEISRAATQRQELETQIADRQQSLEHQRQHLAVLEQDLDRQAGELERAQTQLQALEQSGKYEQFFQQQTALQQEEENLQAAELRVRSVQQHLTDREQQLVRLQEKMSQIDCDQSANRQHQADLINQQAQTQGQQEILDQQIQRLQQQKSSLESQLRSQKEARDAADRKVREYRLRDQEITWQIQKSQEHLAELLEHQGHLEQQLQEIILPDPPPIVPDTMTIEQAQLEQRRTQKRLQSMEPVNMMAITEYESVTARRTELSSRLETLHQERTELLLRIENFTTLRQQAFMQAFDAVNANFQTIFAELSDGDGHLQLENPADPLGGGLTLVAHPKGKPVRHLTSMSGGEKSLTALSFIFALQRFRPSPFYAFDEVDMFLDGSNVERLAQMVRKQAAQAQFIVVSLRRPMIDAAERTIGVTQARGMHTQVLGLAL